MPAPPALTILIPFFNEAGNVRAVIDEIHDVLGTLAFEIICVNDCSQDDTGRELAAVQERYPETVTVLTHLVRRGKSAALFTGLKSARADWIQMLDGDGQNDPRDTARIWEELGLAQSGASRLGLVAGRRNSRNDSGFRWVQSRIANGVRRFLLGDDVTDTGCGWKLIRTSAFRDLPYFTSMHRFLPALVKRAGWDVSEALVNDRPRISGESKYGLLGRLGAGIFDLFGMLWLIRRGGYGLAAEWDDPRCGQYRAHD